MGKIEENDVDSLIQFINENGIINCIFSFYIQKEIVIEAIELKIENCIDPEEDYKIYEMGIIINNEFYDLEHDKNCSWKKRIEKKGEILSFKTLLFNSVTSNKRPLCKTFNLTQLVESGEINECSFRTENSTLFLNC